MTLEVDFVPFATGSGANVTAQSTYIAETSTSAGFSSGVAVSADCNKAWRQGTSMAAAVANFMANELNANVLDNGSISTLTTQLTDAVTTNATAAATTVVNSTLASFTLPFTSVTGQIANAQVPQGAVTQFQGQLQINGTQITAGQASLLEALMLSNAVTLEADPGGTPANGTPGTIVAYY